MGWFPLCKALMEDSQGFRDLTHSGKLYLWFLMSEYNKRGAFYQSDKKTASLLGLDEKTLSRARGRLKGLGWIYCNTGTIKGGKHLATEYDNVKWAKTKQISQHNEGPYAKMDRYTFNVIRAACGIYSPIKPADVIVMVYLYYWCGRYGESGSFHIHKERLAQLTDVSKAHNRVEKILQALNDMRGGPVFSLEKHHHELHFSGWGDFIDPNEAREPGSKQADLQGGQPALATWGDAPMPYDTPEIQISWDFLSDLHSKFPGFPTPRIMQEIAKARENLLAQGWQEGIRHHDAEEHVLKWLKENLSLPGEEVAA
jgi:hypothetical protein